GVFLDGRSVQYDDGETQNSALELGMHTTFPNHCAAVPKGMPSTWKAASGSLTLAMVYLPERGQVLLEKMTIGALHPVLLRDELLVSLTRQLKSASMAQQPLSREYEKCLIEAFLGQLDWLVSTNQTPQPKHRSTLSDVVISNALSLIDHHLNDTLTIGSLCGELQITPTIFRSRFRAATGLPVHRYILLRRLTVAREFVETSKMPLQIVASYCGFSSQSHMTSLFKRHLGVTPSDLRRGACAPLPSR
ncbi:helix-turn-helix domain-containing protein, partial [Duganella vulcania]